MMRSLLFGLISMALCTCALAEASALHNLKWPNLIPKSSATLKDPLSSLTQDQRFDFETVVWARGLTPEQRKLPENEQAVADAQKYERDFKSAGIDIGKLMVAYAEWEKQASAQRKRIVSNLDGKRVRLAGYLLPLEFSGKGERDFLLVPYVGACVHVPPPPPNQIVLVKLKQSFAPKDLYTPVWVEGKMRTKATSKSLSLIDGTREVSVGYHIDSGAIEIYKDK